MPEKQYTPGAVSISTEEYRDLITEMTESKQNADQSRSQKWAAEKERDEARKELAGVKSQYAKLHDFVNSSDELKLKHKLYLVENSQPEGAYSND